jgi:hypothetical protein
MKAWAQGKWREDTTYGYDGEPDYAGPEPIAVPERKLEEMEVVKVEVREMGIDGSRWPI